MIREFNDNLTLAYLPVNELDEAAESFGLSKRFIEECRKDTREFRSGIFFDEKCTYTRLRFFDPTSDEPDDCLAIHISRGKIVIADIFDLDDSTLHKLNNVLSRINKDTVTMERFLYTFIDELVSGDAPYLETILSEITEMEQSILDDNVPADFNKHILEIKGKLHRLHNQYEQYLDLQEVLESNENNILPDGGTSPIMISSIEKRISRFKSSADYLSEEVDHLQNAYSSHLDIKMNRNMMFLTGLTTIFFPLTLITGWYGMNFKFMPELGWRFGYIYVILLSAGIVVLLYLWAKKKKLL